MPEGNSYLLAAGSILLLIGIPAGLVFGKGFIDARNWKTKTALIPFLGLCLITTLLGAFNFAMGLDLI